jgi:hypothetical protein
MVGPLDLAGRARGTVTPGICGISVLKRSDGGWSGIRAFNLRTDFILETHCTFKMQNSTHFQKDNLVRTPHEKFPKEQQICY